MGLPSVVTNQYSLTTETQGCSQKRTMTSVPTHPLSGFNWLEAISGDNGNLDPRQVSMDSYIRTCIDSPNRTYQVHQTTAPHKFEGRIYESHLYSAAGQTDYNRPNSPDSEEIIFQDARLEDWVDTNQQIAQSSGLKPPEDCETSSILSTETLMEDSKFPLQLEAEPPYPTSIHNKSAWIASNNTKLYREPPTEMPSLSYGDEDTSEESETNSCDDALFPFCQPLRAQTASPSTGNADSTECEPQWLIPLAGQVIFHKTCGAIRKIRRKFSRGSVKDGH